MDPCLDERLEQQRGWLTGWLAREASGLLRFEDLDDLAQGVFARALGAAEDFRWRDLPSFRAWLVTLARRQVADRHDHWRALKRGAGRVVRLTLSERSAEDTAAAVAPPSTGAGPRTFAEGREQLVLVVQALDTLPERDRLLVRWNSQGLGVKEMAKRLELGHDATQRAAHRALERLRKAYRVLASTG